MNSGRCDDCNEKCESLSGDPDRAMFCEICVEATIPFQNTWAEDFCDLCKLRKEKAVSIEEKEIRSAERQNFIQGLRECADFLEQHPDLPVPGSPSGFYCFTNSKEELASFARSMGTCEKHAEGNYFWIDRKFGSIRYEINIERAKVCVRKVVGKITVPAEEKDVVEWECQDSLLG